MTAITTHRTSRLGQREQLNQLLLRSLVGHPHTATLLHFWSSTTPDHPGLIATLSAWHEQYRPLGVAFLSIHVPEYAFSHDPVIVEAAARQVGIAWPVVNDAHGELALRFHHHVMPHLVVLDARGQIAHDQLGGQLEPVEHSLRTALANAGVHLPSLVPRAIHQHRFGTLCHPSSPSYYFGHERAMYKNIDPIAQEIEATYSDPRSHAYGPALSGRWYVDHESARSSATGREQYLSAVVCGLTASIVAHSDEAGVSIRIQLGEQPLPSHLWGPAITADGNDAILSLRGPGLYSLIASQRLLSGTDVRLYPNSPGITFFALHTSGCPVSAVD